MTTKPIYASKTIIGAMLCLTASLLQLFGIDLTAVMQAEIANALVAIMTGGGALLTVYGRITAKTQISVGRSTGITPVLVLVIGLPLLGACAGTVAETDAQRVYGIQADYTTAQQLALDYINLDHADGQVIERIKQADAVAYGAITAAQAAVRAGDDPAIPAMIAAARTAVALLVDTVPTD